MLTTVLTAVLGVIGKLAMDWLADTRNRDLLREAGAKETQLQQSEDSNAALEAELDAAVNKAPQSSSDAVRRLRGGSA